MAAVTKVDPLGVAKYGEAWHRKINLYLLGATICVLLSLFFFIITFVSFHSNEVNSVNKQIKSWNDKGTASEIA